MTIVVPKKKSKKTFFFDFIKSAPRWEFVGRHYDTLRLYDDQWRTPEVHKNSTLRKAFANGQYDPNPLYALVNSWFGLWYPLEGILRHQAADSTEQDEQSGEPEPPITPDSKT